MQAWQRFHNCQVWFRNFRTQSCSLNFRIFEYGWLAMESKSAHWNIWQIQSMIPPHDTQFLYIGASEPKGSFEEYPRNSTLKCWRWLALPVLTHTACSHITLIHWYSWHDCRFLEKIGGKAAELATKAAEDGKKIAEDTKNMASKAAEGTMGLATKAGKILGAEEDAYGKLESAMPLPTRTKQDANCLIDISLMTWLIYFICCCLFI